MKLDAGSFYSSWGAGRIAFSIGDAPYPKLKDTVEILPAGLSEISSRYSDFS